MFETKLEKLEDALLENISGGSGSVEEVQRKLIKAANVQIDEILSDQPRAGDFAAQVAALDQSAQEFRQAGASGSSSIRAMV